MRLRVLATTGTALVMLLAGCGGQTGEPISVGNNPTTASSASAPKADGSQPAALDNAAALKLALEAAGITDVHPVKNRVAAWAAVPGFKRCPMYFEANQGETYSVTHLYKPGGEIVAMNMEGTTANPDVTQILAWAANNTLMALSCRGSEAPADNDWPTGPPQ